MQPERQFLPPRQLVVYQHTRRMLDSTTLCLRKFATRVAEQYIGLNAPDVRQVPFRWGVTGDDLTNAEKHNGQVIGRYMDGTVKCLPADLEDAWVLAMPEPFRSDCERDLARRRGMLAVKLAKPEAAVGAVTPGAMLVEMGQLVDALGAALADNRITEADRPLALRILNESDDLITAVLQVRRQITTSIPGLVPGE